MRTHPDSVRSDTHARCCSALKRPDCARFAPPAGAARDSVDATVVVAAVVSLRAVTRLLASKVEEALSSSYASPAVLSWQRGLETESAN